MSGAMPVLRHIANLWTLLDHPWSLDEKLRAFKDAGFDGVCWGGSPELRAGCEAHGLIFVGGVGAGKAAGFSRPLQEQKDCGGVSRKVHPAPRRGVRPQTPELCLAPNAHGGG